jgi:hypothetical protein
VPDELQYGQRSQLQALGQKELGITGGMRPGRAAGRPSGSGMSDPNAQLQGVTPGPDQYQVPEDQQAVMKSWFRAAKAYRTAAAYAAMPNAGPWAQWAYMAAQQNYETASIKLKTGTPDWEF